MTGWGSASSPGPPPLSASSADRLRASYVRMAASTGPSAASAGSVSEFNKRKNAHVRDENSVGSGDHRLLDRDGECLGRDPMDRRLTCLSARTGVGLVHGVRDADLSAASLFLVVV